MSVPLPLRANLEWLKKLAKERLAELRAGDPEAKLSDAQLAVARTYGFASWRKLKAHVEQLRAELGKLSKADPSEPPAPSDDPELTQLLSAVNAGDTNLVAQLLQRRPILARSHGPDGQTPLHAAARCNDPQLGMLLLAYGADSQAKYGQSGHTALSWAVVCNAPEFARMMVKLGHKPDLYCAAGLGLLDEVRAHFDESGQLRPGAVQTGSSRYAADGSRLPSPPETPAEQISDALYMACRNAHAEVVRFLLSKGPDIAFRSFMGGTLLHWAYFGGSREVVDMLKQDGADPAARDNDLHCTPRAFGICAAANWGFDFLVRKRLAEDPSLVNPMDPQTSPLHEAARGGHAEVVRILLEHGADAMYRDAGGRTAADIAAGQGHTGIVEVLRNASPSGGGSV